MLQHVAAQKRRSVSLKPTIGRANIFFFIVIPPQIKLFCIYFFFFFALYPLLIADRNIKLLMNQDSSPFLRSRMVGRARGEAMAPYTRKRARDDERGRLHFVCSRSRESQHACSERHDTFSLFTTTFGGRCSYTNRKKVIRIWLQHHFTAKLSRGFHRFLDS